MSVISRLLWITVSRWSCPHEGLSHWALYEPSAAPGPESVRTRFDSVDARKREDGGAHSYIRHTDGCD